MTKSRAERLTGCEVRRLQEGDADGRIVYGALRGDELIVEATHVTDDLALQILVHQIYTIRARSAQTARLAMCEVPQDPASADSSPPVPVPWRHPPTGKSRAGLLGLPQIDPQTGANEMTALYY